MSELLTEDDFEAVVFGGASSRLTLAFDPASLRGGQCEEVWPEAMAVFDAPGLHAKGKVSFFPGSLERFARELEAAHATLSGEAKIESEDGELSVRALYANGGDVTISGHFQPQLYDASVLNYQIDTDQSYLNATITRLRGLFG